MLGNVKERNACAQKCDNIYIYIYIYIYTKVFDLSIFPLIFIILSDLSKYTISLSLSLSLSLSQYIYIYIDDKPLANVEHLKYLGSTIFCDGSLDREIDNRISKASQALGTPAIKCSANSTSAYLRNWRSTMPWFFPLWLWDVDTISQAYQETGALPHASSPLHPGNQVAGPHHQSKGPRSS